jgi:hypothetical protein
LSTWAGLAEFGAKDGAADHHGEVQIEIVLAAVVAALHGAALVYIVLGGFLGLRDVRWLLPHLATVAWVVVGGALLAVCPLTSLEKWLIVQGGGTPYDGNFIGHYVVGTFYPTSLAETVRFLSLVVVLASWAMVVHRHAAARRPSVAA